MKLNLPRPAHPYDVKDEADTRKAIEQAIAAAQGKADDILIIRGVRMFWEDEVTGQKRRLYLSNGEFKLGDPL